MIRVTVELDRLGLGEDIKTLGTLDIVNDGTGDSDTGYYRGVLYDAYGNVLAETATFAHVRRQGWAVLLDTTFIYLGLAG